VLVLRSSVVPRGWALGLLATKGNYPSGLQRTGRRAELLGVKSGFLHSRCRAVVSDVLACVHIYILYVCVYICVCVYVCGHVYVYICACVYVYVYVCVYTHVYMYVYA